ncbi:conserved exported protein of unknown function (plasmid) [Rhodovastum atsumiense]|uniref:Uncharacterized protein n=1 Tax=Rhodovastum atsumiense TaxID=504468 RepID=A0A5M6IUG6_9PROT|nr:hypothetical protein [Rhodovastum atsumiense]KAA5611589.1 hypothetical protein F1189_13575 [Rhodovastum atsumiense]CAH2606328.1 conserved exported protein of unknown function [Rhodovastum atsumiense]
MKPLHWIIIVGVSAFLPTNVQAAKEVNNHKIIGMGSVSCINWLMSRTKKTEIIAQWSDLSEQWVLGYISGIGWTEKFGDPLAKVNANDVWNWIDHYCTNHFDSKLSDAANEFIFKHATQNR